MKKQKCPKCENETKLYKKRIIFYIVFILIIVLILPQRIFARDISWCVRYDYNDSIIQNLIKEKEEEETTVNVEPQKNAFDIIIFMGQSNMVGQGDASQAVEAIDGAGYEMEFNSQGEPYGLSKIQEPFGESDSTISKSKGSMVTAFMNSYYLNTGVPVVGIPGAINGSSIYDYWQEGQTGLENAKTKYEKTYQWMKNNGYKVRHAYMIWYQGEADRDKYITNSDGTRTYSNGTITYEAALKNTVTEMYNVGIEKSFLISIGGYYVLEGYENDDNKTIYTDYEEMMQYQKNICKNNDWITLASERASTLTKCKDMITADENGKHYGIHLNQEALDIVGSEAGKNVAKYADQARETTLTKKQSSALIDFARQFAKSGFEERKLVYGINNKAAAYNLQLVQYKKAHAEAGLINFGAYGHEYGWNGETIEEAYGRNQVYEYIGLDCSGFISFLYHHVFGLSFNYWHDNMNKPWSTEQYIKNSTISDSNETETFKIIYEQHSKEQKHSLYDLVSLATLQPGDLLIGRGGKNEEDNTNHIVIYAGKDENGVDKIIHATGNPGLYDMYIQDSDGNKIYYYMGESNLSNSTFKYRNVYVLRLNDDIIPKDYVYNDKAIDWNKLSTAYPYDDMAPIILDIKGNPTDWTNQKVTLTINAVDEGKVCSSNQGVTWEGRGLEKQAYSFDGGQTWQESNQKTFTENNSIKVQVRDVAGNIQENTVDITKIDRTPPTITISPNGANVSQKQNVTITVEDIGGSGLSSNNSYQYQLGTSRTEVPTETWQNYTSGTEFTIGQGLTGDYYLWIKTIADNVGNKSTETEYMVSEMFTFDNDIVLDTTPPEINVEYNTKQLTNKSVLVTIKANEPIQKIEGWILLQDKMTLIKEYTENVDEEITVSDLAGNEKKANILIRNIDRTPPEVEIEYSTQDKTKDSVTVTIVANEQIQQLDEWTISENSKMLTKIYTENVDEYIDVYDLAGNKSTIPVKISNIDTNEIQARVEYSETKLTNKSVTVEIMTNKEIKEIEGWTLSQDKMKLTKEYMENADETVKLQDFVGNEREIKISVQNIDMVSPKVNVSYSTLKLTNDDVIVTIISDEQVQELNGWTISEDGKMLKRIYSENNQEVLKIYDLAGNEIEVEISVNNIQKDNTKDNAQELEKNNSENSYIQDTAPMRIPNAGKSSLKLLIIIAIIVSILLWIKNRKFKDI